MNAHHNAPTYAAFRVNGTPTDANPHTVVRTRLGHLFTSPSATGGNIVITGPAGAGKSTMALQVALQIGGNVHYVCARKPRLVWEDGEFLPSTHRYAELIAGILNALVAPGDPQSRDHVESALRGLAATKFTTHDVLILDDLDLIPLQHLTPFQDMLADWLPQIETLIIIYVARQYTDELRYLVEKRGIARVLPSTSLLITETELSAMIETKVFGDAPENLIHTVWQQTGGWFTGMRYLIDTNGAYSPALEDYILREMVMPHTQTLQTLYLAYGSFPQISPDMINWLVPRLPDTPDSVSGLRDVIPLLSSTHPHASGTTFAIPEAIAICLNAIARKYGHLDEIQPIQQLGIDWFLSRDDVQSARELAIAANQTDYYLDAIYAQCSNLALTEKWTNIRALVRGIAPSSLLHHSDFVFWLIMSNMYDGLWPDVTNGRSNIIQQWKADSDPLKRGRALLLESWEIWANAHDKEIHELAA